MSTMPHQDSTGPTGSTAIEDPAPSLWRRLETGTGRPGGDSTARSLDDSPTMTGSAGMS